MDAAKLRAWWWHRQGLDGRLANASAAEVLGETGWARSVGGSNPYLTLFARARIGREAADRAAAALEIYELPAARGCTYVLPASDFALALKAGLAFAGNEREVALKLGATDAEIDKLRDGVVDALAKSPLDTDALRQVLGGAVRKFGPEGVKKGLTTTLPVALGELQAAGEIRRVPLDGRFDQQRYRYARWRPNPLAKYRLSDEETYTELARRFFRWSAPALASEFQTFAGIGVKAAKAAISPLGLVPLENGDDRLLLPEDREAFERFRIPRQPQYGLVSVLDGMALFRHDATDLLAPTDASRRLIANYIFDRGRLIGQWAYDKATESIAWSAFIPATRQLNDAVKETEEFIRSELGDARLGGQDNPKGRAATIAALRA